jgi:DNA gyrase inhibitor GyrI
MQVEIKHLEPMRVAYVNAFSETPEHDAWQLIRAWTESRGILQKRGTYRIFGHNNPDPLFGQTRYGYDFWVTAGPDVVADPGERVQIKEHSGGLYAVMTCVGGPQRLGEVWKQLHRWVQSSPYSTGRHQWLEECFLGNDDRWADRIDCWYPLVDASVTCTAPCETQRVV